VELGILRSPTKVLENGIELGINELDGQERAIPTGHTETVQTDLVVNSVGYRSEPIEAEWFDGGLGRVRQSGSKVLGPDQKVVDRVYASGWAANGAKGVLASTMMDAYGVVEGLLEEALASDVSYDPALPPEIVGSGKRIVTYADWKRVDAEEIRRGEALNKERERMTWSEVENFLG